MKIKDLDMKCGECGLIDYCDEPFSDVCICGEERLREIKVDSFLKYLETSEVVNRDTTEEKQLVIDDAYKRIISNNKSYQNIHLGKFTYRNKGGNHE